MKTKMKEGWMPSKETIMNMMSSCPEVNIQYEKDKFVDYYLANGGVSANWEATFRNWIRRADEYRIRNDKSTGHTATSTDSIQTRRRRILSVAKQTDTGTDGNTKRLSKD